MTFSQFIITFLLGGLFIGGFVFVELFAVIAAKRPIPFYAKVILLFLWPLIVLKGFINLLKDIRRDSKN